jgi:hypothetical protein
MDNDKLGTTPPLVSDASVPPAGARGEANQILSRAGDLASQTVEQARSLGASARERLLHEADDKKGRLARTLDELAGNVESGKLPEVGGEIDELQRKLTGGAARAMRSVSRKLEEQSTEELIASAGRAIRQRPGLFLAGCLAIGFLGGRMLRR